MRRVALATLLFATVAHADRETAALAHMKAHATKDPAKFVACGAAFLDVYNSDPIAPDSDAMLFEAGDCFEQGHSLGAASQAFLQIRATQRTSKLRGKAIVRAAKIDEFTGGFAKAAELYEEYARGYASEADAADLLENALTYRLALDHDAKAIADAGYYAKLVSALQPELAAAILLRVEPIHEKSGDAVAFIRGLLRDYRLSNTQLVVANAKLGELLWDATCKGRAQCITELKPDKTPRCSDGVRVHVDKRSDTKAAEAVLEDAVKAYERGPKTDPIARNPYAMTKLRLAERDLEAFLAVDLPGDVKHFNDSIQLKMKLGAAATHAFEEILAIKDPDATIAAAARLAQLSNAFATTLRTAEIPHDLRTGELAKDKTAAYCEKMAEVAEPLAMRAKEALEICLQKAGDLRVDNEWSTRCRKDLDVRDPKHHVDEPHLGKFAMLYPQPTFAAPLRPARDPSPEYAAAFAVFEGAWTGQQCAATSAKLKPLASEAARYLYGLVEQRCGRDPKQIWEALAIPEALASRGTLKWLSGDRKGAIDAWERAIQGDGKQAAASYGLALSHFEELGKEQDVQFWLLSARAVDTTSAAASIMLANLALRRGAPKIALLELEHVPSDPPGAWVTRAAVQIDHGDWSGAARLLDNAHAPYDLALALLHIHRPDAAIEKLVGVPITYDVQIARGAALLGIGKRDEAREAFRDAAKLDGTRPEAAYDLALVK